MSIHQFHPQRDPQGANDEPNILSSGMGAPPVSHGHEVERILPDDDLDQERMTEQGVEDAETDSMEQARREQDRKDSL